MSVDRKRIFVLGAYGQVGRSVCRLLVEQTEALVVLAGRRSERLDALAAAIGQPERVTTCVADASQPESLRGALRGSDLLIMTATARECVEHVARACIECGCDYLDTLETEDAVLALRGLEDEMRRAGRLFIVECGLAPGMSGVLLRHAHASFARLRHAHVAMAFSLQTIESKEQVYDIFEFVVKNRPVVYRNGQWRSQSLSADRVVVDCGPRFGMRRAIPLDMFETRALPPHLGLDSFGYYAATSNALVDALVRRLLMALRWIGPRFGWSALASLALRLSGSKKDGPRGAVVVVEAEGEGGRERSLHLLIDVEDNYRAVAQAAVVVARQRLAGAFDGKTGVHIMGELVDPSRTLADLAALGIPCRETWKTAPLA